MPSKKTAKKKTAQKAPKTHELSNAEASTVLTIFSWALQKGLPVNDTGVLKQVINITERLNKDVDRPKAPEQDGE